MSDDPTPGDGRRSMPGTTEGHLRVVSENIPPPSQANDTIITFSAVLAAVAGLVFAITLLAGLELVWFGSALAVALMSLGVAVRRYFTDHFADVEAIEEREIPGDTTPDEPISPVATTGRRPFLRNVMIGSAGVVGVSTLAAVPSLGPLPSGQLSGTRWAPGVRLVDAQDERIRPEDVAGGGVETVWPEGDIGHERSSVILVHLSGEQPLPPTNPEWVVQDRLIAYSKVCTHAGCPVGLFREQDNALFCPCHQSTFDARRGAEPTFGPAARALPQLPLGLDDEGFLVATGDFQAQVGPAYG
jgi:ubiquinol-cytochrome c reductase iron-sulfur subunit